MPITGYSNTISVTTAFDADALAYINALSADGYPLEAPEQTYINTLVTDFKSAGIWSKMKAIYPYCTSQRNLIGYSEDFGNASWLNSDGASITTNQTTAPNGTNTADLLQFGTIESSRCQQFPFPNATYTFSLYVKTVTGTTTIRFGNWDSLDIINVTNQWQRITVTKSVTNNGVFTIRNNSSGNSSDIYIWGAQLEIGSTATTYQPVATTASTIFASQFKYNLKDPRNLDAAFRQVFNGGWTYSKQGATPNGTNGYADTKLNPSASLSQNSAHLSVYSRTNIANTGSMIGLYNGSFSNSLMLYPNLLGNAYINLFSSGGTNLISASNSLGFRAISRVNSSEINYYNLTTKTTLAISSTTSTNNTLYIGANNNNGVGANYDFRQNAFTSIGDGLSDTEASAMYTSVQNYNTSMSRAV